MRMEGAVSSGNGSERPIPGRSSPLFRRALLLAVSSLSAGVILVAVNAYSPSDTAFLAIQLLFVVFILSSVAAAVVGVALLWRSRADLRDPILFLFVVSLSIFLLHVYTINLPPTTDCYDTTKQAFGCIMDEVYYVPAAQSLLAGKQCQPYADACNLEHPYLAKALIAVGIELFGLTDFGWRILPTILGTLSIPLLFTITYMLSRKMRLAYFASLLLAFDTLFFVHSGAALIDVPTTFFAMAGFLVYLYGRGFWKFDNLILSGLILALAGLSKETAVFLFAALLTYHTAFFRGGVKAWAYSLAKIAIPAGIVFIVGLQVYDSLYTQPSLPTFFQHMQFMLKYGASLTGPGWTDDLLKSFITPLNWLTYYTPIAYLVTHVTVSSAQSNIVYVGVGYFGVTNMMMVWMVFFWVPLVVNRWARGGEKARSPAAESEGDLKAGVFALVWFLWGYLPYVGLWLYGRVTYPFYILPAVPALALGTAYFTTREWFSSRLATVYLVANFAWFFWYFPDKAFLPDWVRALIGR